MNYKASTPEEYESLLPEDRKEAIGRLREAIKSNLPQGFEETMSYRMIVMWCRLKYIPKGIM